jgi:hypothetical protein
MAQKDLARGGTSDAVGRQDLPRRNEGDSSAMAMKEVVLRCRNCDKHQVLSMVGQRCDCMAMAGRWCVWHGWEIAHIAPLVDAVDPHVPPRESGPRA